MLLSAYKVDIIIVLPIVCCFVSWRLGRPHRGNADGAEGIFRFCRTRAGCGPTYGPTLKKVLVRWWINKINCLNFWDEACWFLSLRVFGLLSSTLLLFPKRFGRYVLWPFSGVCRTRERSRNFELRPLLNPRGSPVLIPLAITGYKC